MDTDSSANILLSVYWSHGVRTSTQCLSRNYPILLKMFNGVHRIALSNGVIRDFAGPYFVSEDNMAFGRPTRYLALDPFKVIGGAIEWDECVSKASVIYGTRMHNLFCDNCHSHVGLALRLMNYEGGQWNMIRLAFWMFFCGKYVGWCGAVKTWAPFIVIVIICGMTGWYL